METIGVIGDGKIGLPICERLLNSGDRVIGYGRSAGKDLVDDIDVRRVADRRVASCVPIVGERDVAAMIKMFERRATSDRQ
jgi:3-hydroxyisobutyrate dehydrogenase-like beta-hydroxyacid dehydrogenase